MHTYIALLRGINVGGRNSLPMKKLVELFGGMGLENIQTYIQSGNVVFQSSRTSASRLQSDIGKDLNAACSFEPDILVLTNQEFSVIMDNCPFDRGEAELKSVHIFFLKSKPEKSSLDRLDSLCSSTEKFELGEKALYLYAPDGIGRSKLAAGVEKAVGVSTTARNWRTVMRLAEMAKSNS